MAGLSVNYSIHMAQLIWIAHDIDVGDATSEDLERSGLQLAIPLQITLTLQDRADSRTKPYNPLSGLSAFGTL